MFSLCQVSLITSKKRGLLKPPKMILKESRLKVSAQTCLFPGE